jgi:hypothetical protein
MTHKRYKTVKKARWKYFKQHYVIGSLEHKERYSMPLRKANYTYCGGK